MGNRENLWNKFDKPLSQVIVYAEAASIESGVDCLYVESLVIGILTTGENIVNSALLKMDVNLMKCLKSFKDLLVEKKKYNEGQSVSNIQDIKISKHVIEVCRTANKIREEKKLDKITIACLFLAILQYSKNIKELFEKEGFNYSEFDKKTQEGQRDIAHAGEDHKKGQKTSSALASFCTNLTDKARYNELDPIISREKEIDTAITILCRRGKNNPILLGEPGVGKTAVVEGIAQRIVSGLVPKMLIDCKLYSLNIASLVAGTKYRGDFEERIQSLIKEIQGVKDCILFIDEIHTLVGAGSAAGGALDASNILKPFLARNDLKCIGATTLDDFKKYFQKDGALTRRFQQIMIEEPSKEQMYKILSGIKHRYEEYHHCIISVDVIDSIINLTSRYLADKYFPDKAIDCMDMACAKHTASDMKGLAYVEGNVISSTDIARVVSEQCSIPIEVILWDDNERIKKIETTLNSSVIGQIPATSVVCKILKNSYSGIRNPNKPIGSFVFGGQSGTGKTHMAKQLANALFGKESAMIRLDMSEFSESHSVSKLIGSPPGYVGFQEVDVFVDKIKRKPYSIVLLDEMEKASPDVMKLFLQVMSDGIMTDAIGNKVDFKNIVLIMTGNFGMNETTAASLGFSDALAGKSDIECEKSKLMAYCQMKYGVEFVNRVDEFVPFMPLSDKSLNDIAKLEISKITARLSNRKCKLIFSEEVFELLIERSKSEHGRNANILNRVICKEIEPCISDTLLTMGNDGKYDIHIKVKDKTFISTKKKARS